MNLAFTKNIPICYEGMVYAHECTNKSSAMPKLQGEEPEKTEIAKMFHQSIAPFSKKLVALHPHLYGSLYHRASEIQALDKIQQQLNSAVSEAKMQRYQSLPSILEALKEALIGQPELSWWNLFTASVGQAFGGIDVQKKNLEEQSYLSAISNSLTEIIRNYQSPNSKLLLEIRLIALEVDTRLVELEKIPEGAQQVNETLDYLLSQFKLLIEELTKVLEMAKENWSNDCSLFLNYTEKADQLMKIAKSVEQTDHTTYTQFVQHRQIQTLEEKIESLFQGLLLKEEPPISNLDPTRLLAFADLAHCFPNALLKMEPRELYTLLGALENWFVADPNLKKVRPEIFFSQGLKKYVLYQSTICKERFDLVKAVSKGTKTDPQISKHPVEYYKNCFILENDLHHICSLVHSKENGLAFVSCNPDQLQKEVLNRMIGLANGAQPKELDMVLKSFSEEEKEERYFLTQEVILEQFIRWRKMGIY